MPCGWWIGALVAWSGQDCGQQDLFGTRSSAIGTSHVAGVSSIFHVPPLPDVAQLLMSTLEPRKALGEFMTYRC